MTAIRPLLPSEIETAVAAQSDGFMADPFFNWLVPEVALRRPWLAALMRANFRFFAKGGLLLTVDSPSHGGLVAAPPGAYPAPFIAQIAALAGILAKSAASGLWRGGRWRVGLQALAAVTRLHIQEPHWYLATFSLATQSQSKGYGRQLLEQLLAHADRDRVPVHLETSNRANLGFYGRFGFIVQQEVGLPFGSPPIWTMTRPATKE